MALWARHEFQGREVRLAPVLRFFDFANDRCLVRTLTAMDREPSTRKRMLLVDDDQVLREALFEFFHREGFSVCQAADGDEAFRLIRTERVDFSVMDFHLPGMTGVDVLHKLLAERGLTAIPPTILMSSDKSAANELRPFFGAPIQFTPKPIRLDALRRTIQQLLHPPDVS